jgi:hypothetical protein
MAYDVARASPLRVAFAPSCASAWCCASIPSSDHDTRCARDDHAAPLTAAVATVRFHCLRSSIRFALAPSPLVGAGPRIGAACRYGARRNIL